MVRAIAYIRVSTDRQATDGTSLVTQRRRVIEFTTLKGYQLKKQFVEEGESAKTDNRPVLKEMLTYCEQERGNIDVLVFPKIDRFARYSEDYHPLKRHLRNLGIRVESIDERFDDSPAGRFLESMLAATAQFDNDVRSERTYNGMREAVAQGRYVWRAPVGYRNVRIDGIANIEVNPNTAPLIIEAFERVARKNRVAEVIDWLNEHGIPMRRNGFYAMLRNKVYIGLIDSFGLQSRGALPFTPLVSVELFEMAQAALRSTNYPETVQRDHADFPLRGTVRCPCGHFLTACWSVGRSDRYPYYRCRKCSRVNIKRDFVERQFRRALVDAREIWLVTDEIAADLREFWERDRADIGVRAKKLDAERERIEAQQRSLVEKVAGGVVPDHLAQQQFEDYDQRLRQIQARLAEVENPDTGEPHIDKLVEFGNRFLEQIDERWHVGDVVEKKRLQSFLFPAGTVVVPKDYPRTGNSAPVSGSDGPSFDPVVLRGGPQRQRCEPRDLSCRIAFLKEVYEAFGRDVAA
ncbi:MAG TPA: recombinase family protein [Fimbriimonadaceae bacterium]|nr:recombinase family protein [Fimbriimonadaceae bacterium]